MLQEQIYNYLFSKIQQDSDITFASGYTYTHYDNNLMVVDLSTMNAMNYQKVDVVPFAENFITERTFVEKINRTEYEAEYVVIFPVEKEDDCIQALQDFRDRIFASPVTDIVDGGKTYRCEFKVSRGQKKATSAVDDGTVYVTYGIMVFMTIVENGILNSDVTFKIAKDGETLVEIDTIEHSIASESATDPNAKFKQENIKQNVISRVVSGTAMMYYRGNDIDKDLLNQITGKANREQLYNIEIIIDGVTFTYDVYIKKGDFTITKGAVFYLSFSWVEA
jgi:hypothetical protein